MSAETSASETSASETGASETRESDTKVSGDTADASSHPEFSQGFLWEGASREELVEVIEAAFDYRGDVTISIDSGKSFEGFLANRDAASSEPCIDIFLKSGGRQRVYYSQVTRLHFSGKDTASGKSWETWLAKWNAKKDAEKRGEVIGDISLHPEDLDE